ncbi:MAG: hypothetical protein M1817_005100 [Caeruleum heppii]|nr:MAG: hypothetical protein M1817_005100 [Caeruleum heppii]
MHSVAAFVPAVLGLASLALAQIDPGSVPAGTKANWCNSQITSCPLLCSQQADDDSLETNENYCNTNSLTFSCVCGDGQTPNASEYSQTLPYFICVEQANQCVAACGGNSQCQAACRENRRCGAQAPTRVNTSTISTMTSTDMSTATDGAVYTGFGDSAAATTGGAEATATSTPNAAMTALNLGRSYGLIFLTTGVLAGFVVLL